jgi:hypothetical protein
MSTGFKLKAKYGGRHIAALMKLSGKDSVFVGVMKGAGNYPGTDTSIAEVAWFNEFGTTFKAGRSGGETVIIPERPFLRWTLAEHDGYFPELGKALISALRNPGRDHKKYLRAVGLIAEQDIRDMITSATRFEPNADSTIRKKGSDHPLIDIGLLRQAITSALVKGE